MLYMMDVDGTVIKPFYAPEASGKHGTDITISDYMKVELMPGVRKQIQRLIMADPQASYALVTNQGGVAFGFQTIEHVGMKMSKVLYELEFFHGRAFSVHVCYTHPKAELAAFRVENDPRRKPGCAMLDEAMVAHRIRDRHFALYVGDLASDQQAALAAGVAFMHAHDFFGASVHTPSAETI